MRLVGTFKGTKSGTFTPDESKPNEKYPWINASVKDADNGAKVKVKPASGDEDDMGEFSEVLADLSVGDDVAWVVDMDKYGNYRFVELVEG